MANKVLSIEIGQSLTRVIEVDYKSNKPKIYKYFSFPTPEGTINEGVIGEKKADFCRLLKNGLKKNGITTTKTVFTINAASIASRETTIPIVKDNKIQSILIANSSDYFPVDVSQYQLSYQITEKDEENKQYKVKVYAIPQKMVDSYEEIAKVCGLNIQSIDYVGNSIFQVMQKTIPGDLSVSIKVDEKLSIVTVVRNGKIDLQRSVPYGVEGVLESISDSRVIGYKPRMEDVLDYMKRNLSVHKHFDNDETSSQEGVITLEAKKQRDAATEAVQYLVGNISRVLDYYTSRNTDVTIPKIALYGIGAECYGLNELLTNELGIQVIKETEFDLSIQGGGAADYMACVGASIQPLDIARETKKAKEASAKSSESMLSAFIFFGVCLLIALILAIYPLMQNFALNTKQESLKTRITQLQPALEVYNKYVAAQAKYLDAMAMKDLTETPNDALLLFLSELEENIPQSVILDNISAGAEGVTLSLKAEKKEQIAELLVQLRQFESVGTVEVDGFTEETDDAGNKKFTCTVTSTYAIREDEETEEGTAEGNDNVEDGAANDSEAAAE